MNEPRWPVADIDPVRRLRIMAASIPGATYAEEVFARSVHEVWAVAGDLEAEFPMLLGDVRTMRIARADGERLEVVAVGRHAADDLAQRLAAAHLGRLLAIS